MALVMYSKPGCPYCDKARTHYNENNIEFVEYDAQNDLERQKEMLAYTNGDPTVPAFVRDGAYIGSGWGEPPRG